MVSPKDKTQSTDSTEMMTGTDPLTASLRDSRHKRACLMVIYGDPVGRRYWLTKEVTVAGRDPDADFFIDNKKMSRKHFSILQKKPKYYLKDLGSRNGTMVNDKKVEGEKELRYGDKIQCGGMVLQFISEASIEHQLVDKLREESFRDGLTQVYNKKILPDVEKELFEPAKQDKTALGIMMVDIDHFKKVNDTHGHLFGDEVLSTLAKGVKTQVIRAEDIMVRFGGEEFLIIFPRVNAITLTSLAERIRKAAEDLSFNHGGKTIKITISVGTRFFDPKSEPSVLTLASLIEQADQALYQSKQNGRNRVTAYSPK